MLCKHPHYYTKVLEELDQKIVQPYLQKTMKGNGTVDGLDILDLMNYENTSELTFYASCFNESLRM